MRALPAACVPGARRRREHPPARFAGERTGRRPVPGFGDPEARVVIVGLAPAAHGGNRTGRIFTGDRSGDFLFPVLHETGFANQPASLHVGDGLRLSDLYVGAVNRCAPPGNRPTPEERDNCLPYLVRELRVLSALGPRLPGCLRLGWRLRALAVVGFDVRPRPRFGHGAEARSAATCCWDVPPQPAEHIHRQAHARHVSGGFRACPFPRRVLRAAPLALGGLSFTDAGAACDAGRPPR